ncbi:MAG: threonine synthase, partial [Gemmatimonadetes bacterium]|nr:threonine synthase [Gemmatimonadota bacterium]
STLSNAMDVGDPSNMERILGLHPGPDAVRRAFNVSAWSDDATRRCIAHVWDEAGVVLDPHTAVGVLALRHALAVDEDAEGLVLGTAHPAKFGEVVEPIIGCPIPVPDSLRDALRQETTVPSIPPSLDGLISILDGR